MRNYNTTDVWIVLTFILYPKEYNATIVPYRFKEDLTEYLNINETSTNQTDIVPREDSGFDNTNHNLRDLNFFAFSVNALE